MDQDETWHAGRPRPWYIVLDGDPAPPPSKGQIPQFSAHICCGQMSGWIKMPLGMEVGLSPGDFVLRGDWGPSPLPKKGAEPPIFGPYLLRPNGCMDQDATLYGGRPRPRRHCVRWGPSSLLPEKGVEPSPIFGICLSLPNAWMDQDDTWHGGGPWSRPHCTKWGPSSPPPKRGHSPPQFRPIFIVAKRLDASTCTWYGGRP